MSLRSACPLITLAFATGCPGGGGAPDAADALDLDCADRLIAEVRVPGGGYQSLAAATGGAELVLGFQGFRYLYLRARLDRNPGAVAAAAVVQLDGDAARSQPLHITFAPDATGVVTPPMQVFFNDDPLPALVDRGLALQLVLGPRCRTEGHTVLRYDPSCYEGPDGQPVCDPLDAGVAGGP